MPPVLFYRVRQTFPDVWMFCSQWQKSRAARISRLPLFVVWEQTHPLFICIIILHRHQTTNDIAFRSNPSIFGSQVGNEAIFCDWVDEVMAELCDTVMLSSKKIPTVLQYFSTRAFKKFCLDFNLALKLQSTSTLCLSINQCKISYWLSVKCGGRSIDIFYTSKNMNTTMLKYPITSVFIYTFRILL